MRASAGRLRDWWYVAAMPADVTDRRPLARTVLGERLVLWRDRSGAVTALTDRCLHRNAPLSAGDLFDGCVGCPYHGWTYDASGQLVGVPAQADGAEVPALAIRRWPTRESDGLVWVWMGDGPPDKDPFPMPFAGEPGWTHYTMVTDFANGVTQLVENFMDVPHTVFVHAGWFRRPARKRVRMHVERTPDSVLVTYDQPDDRIGFTSRILNPTGEPMVHTDRFYLPNVTRVDYHFGRRGFVITSTCTPVSASETRVYTRIGYNVGSRAFQRLIRPFLPWYTRRVIEQDVQIMQVQGDNLRHHGAEAFHHAEADLHHVWIEQLRAWAAQEEGAPIPGEAREAEFWI